jgi:hypothetical protein
MNAIIKIGSKVYHVTTEVAQYHNGTPALSLVKDDGCPFATISVNLPDSVALPEGAFYVKHWSENEGIPEQLVAQGIITPVDAPVVYSGYVDGIRAYRLGK